MYIPAAPWCPRNEEYERGWANRFQRADLNETGRLGLGLDLG
jgi:hypothetical protein